MEELRRQVWPDFHHPPDLDRSGALVDFLPEEAAGAFCVRGTADQVAEQINGVLDLGFDFEILVPQPMPSPPPDAEGPTYMERIARDLMPRVARD